MAGERPRGRGLRVGALAGRRRLLREVRSVGPAFDEVARFLAQASKLTPSKRRRLLEAVRAALAEQDSKNPDMPPPDSR